MVTSCPVCGTTLVEKYYQTGEWGTEESQYQCPNQCYTETFAYGSTQIDVCGFTTGYHYTTPQKDINEIHRRVEVLGRNIGKEWKNEDTVMGDIKFRAWDKINKRMAKVVGIAWYEGDKDDIQEMYIENPEGGCTRVPANSMKYYELMRFTGLKDKNNIPVWEGDLIRLVTADPEEITIICEFGSVYRQIFEDEVEIIGFYFTRSDNRRKTFPITRNYLGKHDTEIWEVIGNIYNTGV